MSIIVAIGGGENGRPGTQRETKLIDEKIVSLTEKKSPNFLFVGTACHDHTGYRDVMYHNYKKLGCKTESLELENGATSKYIKDKVDRADIIYVSGGDPKYMMEKRKETGTFDIIKYYYQKNIKKKVFCGLSAGCMCWFVSGMNDKEGCKDPLYYEKVKGFGFIPYLNEPHFGNSSERNTSWPRFLKDENKQGLGIDDGAAIVFENGNIEVVSSLKGADVIFCEIENDKYLEKSIGYGFFTLHLT